MLIKSTPYFCGASLPVSIKPNKQGLAGTLKQSPEPRKKFQIKTSALDQ